MRTSTLPILIAAALTAAPIEAQEPPPAAEPPAAPAAERPAGGAISESGEPRLIFEREVFSYQGRARRDPFRPLTTSAGPLFEDLKLNVILWSPVASESVVMLSDSNRQYRLRRGETVGNATVVDIGPTRVVFSVSDFGIRRQEVLDMKAKREGA